MTLQTRRKTYWALFMTSAVMVLSGMVFALLIGLDKRVSVFLAEKGIFAAHSLFGARVSPQALAMIDAVGASIFAAAAVGYILLTFRKTVSTEIFFFAFWLASLAFAPLRLLHLLLAVKGASDMTLTYIDKLYMGARFLGNMTIFISGLYAAGMRNEKQFSIIAACVAIGTALAWSLPVNTGIYDASMIFKVGYGRLIEGFSLAIILITIANYLIAVRVRGDSAYYFTAAGMAVLLAGAYFLSHGLSPLVSLVSLALMALGAFVFVRKLHSFYLWQ